MDKICTVAVIGCGARGCDTYANLMARKPDVYKIEALCDFNEEKLAKYGEMYGVPKDKRFVSDEVFFEEKRADVLVIATLDGQHVEPCLKALSLGYHILLEKPITDNKEECFKLLEAQKKYGGKVLVCHVLRYAPAFLKVKELLDGGAVGKLVSITATENVAYWHYAHSYVRGNWRNNQISDPMILAKCCHDLDLLQFYAQSKCESISSVGDLRFFKKENAPSGAKERCLQCPYVDECVYSAKRIYLDKWKETRPENVWPYNVLQTKIPTTEENLTKALQEGIYGRCVFACDNDVVDHQLTQMTFENGVKASLNMMAFTKNGGRIMKFYGTQGEIVLDEESGFIDIKKFGEEQRRIWLADLLNSDSLDGGYAHGGGDYYLIEALAEMIAGRANGETSLEASIESHLMGIYAEESRLKSGELIYVHKIKK